MDAKLLFVQAISPLHAGTGQGVGVIDLPIAREKATQIPFLPGSSIKGVFRDACDTSKRENIFGPDTNNADAYASSVTFTDARLVLLPTRSLRGVFGWVTSPMLLRRLARDARDANAAALPPALALTAEDQCLVSTKNGLTGQNTKVVLEDLPLTPSSNANVDAWAAWLGKIIFAQDATMQAELMARLCVVSDDVLIFLLETATEISARIRIDDETKTVTKQALWYEEALPAETVLVSLVVASEVKSKNSEVFDTVRTIAGKTLQFGGKASVGRGLCKTILA